MERGERGGGPVVWPHKETEMWEGKAKCGYLSGRKGGKDRKLAIIETTSMTL